MANILLEQAFKALEDVQDTEVTVKDLKESADLDLPTEVSIHLELLVDDPEDVDDSWYLDEVISDYLSDEYGFCHYGFDYSIDKDQGLVHVYDIKWDTSCEEDGEFDVDAYLDNKGLYTRAEVQEHARQLMDVYEQEPGDLTDDELNFLRAGGFIDESLKEEKVCEKCGKNPCECLTEEIKVYCYSKEPQVFKTRKEAIDFFKDAERNSEGSEQERYTNVLFDLEDGLNICWDQVTPLSGEADKAYNAQLKESKHVCEKCGKRVCECNKLQEGPNTTTTISVLDDGEKVIKQVGYSALTKKIVDGKPVYTVKYAPGYVVNTIEAKHDKEAISRFLGLKEGLREELEMDYYVVSYGNPYKALVFAKDGKESALETAKSLNSVENKEGNWEVYHYTKPFDGELKYDIITETCNESKEEYEIEYWVDEEARDHGLGDIATERFSNLEDAKEFADKLFGEVASVEVLDSKGEVVYGRYPEDESLKEDVDVSKVDLDDIIGWISDHDELYSDFKNFFNYEYDEASGKATNVPSKEEVIDWLCKHDQAFNDFKSFFKLKDESLKESHNPSFSELEEWCMNNPVEMIKTIRRIRSGEMTDGDREVFNDFGFDSYSEEELKNKLDELENLTNSWIYDSGDFSEEEIAKIEKELEESLKEDLSKDEKSVSEEHKEDDKVVCAECGSEEVKFNDPETKEPLCDKCYQKKVEKQKEEEKKSLDESITVNINDEEAVKDAKKELEVAEKKADEEEIVVDVDADSVEDLKDSYVGNYILSCDACKTLIYKKPDAVKKDEESGVFNVGEACPHCGSESGYSVVGQVAKASVEVEPEDMSTTGAPEAETKEETKVEVEKEEEKPVLPSAMESMEQKPESTRLEKVDLNEQRFDRLVNKFVHATYENVDKYETKNLYLDDDNTLIVEGVIKYTSGKEKEAQFKLCEKKLTTTKEDVIALNGICEAFNTTEKAFTFRGVISENKLNFNSLTYNFNTKVLNESKNIKGKVCIKY